MNRPISKKSNNKIKSNSEVVVERLEKEIIDLKKRNLHLERELTRLIKTNKYLYDQVRILSGKSDDYDRRLRPIEVSVKKILGMLRF